jgi:rhodanese-related sulfurtransferase
VLATATLKDLGFNNVANREDGFIAWSAAGLPTDEHHADI